MSRIAEIYECPVCDGRGWGRLWKDRDCIEGWKMAPRHPCFFCEETGKVSMNALSILTKRIARILLEKEE